MTAFEMPESHRDEETQILDQLLKAWQVINGNTDTITSLTAHLRFTMVVADMYRAELELIGRQELAEHVHQLYINTLHKARQNRPLDKIVAKLFDVAMAQSPESPLTPEQMAAEVLNRMARDDAKQVRDDLLNY